MKKLSPILIILFCCQISFGSDTTIVFRQSEFSKVFEAAKREQKPVMLFFHFDGCGACNIMIQDIFTKKSVYDFYNSKLVCYALNTLKGEGVELAKRYGVQSCPAFLFLNADGRVVHKIVGLYDTVSFIRQAAYAFDAAGSLSDYRKRYDAGERGSDFLREYCCKLRDAAELDTVLIRMYVHTLPEEDMKRPENIRFIYEFCFHNHEPVLPYGSKGFQFMLSNRKLFNQYFDSSQVNARIVMLASDSLYSAIEHLNEREFNRIIAILKPFDGHDCLYKEMDGRLTAAMDSKHIIMNAQLAFYDKTRDKIKYEKTLDQFIKAIWNSSGELNTIAWNYFEKYDDPGHLNKALKWVKRSVELKSYYANNDTWANLLYKLNRYQEGYARANIAIELAIKEGVDYKSTSELQEKLLGNNK